MSTESLERENAALKQLVVDRAQLDRIATRYEEQAGRSRVALNTVDLSLSEVAVQGKIHAGQMDVLSTQIRDAISIVVQFRKRLSEDMSTIITDYDTVSSVLQKMAVSLDQLVTGLTQTNMLYARDVALKQGKVVQGLEALKAIQRYLERKGKL